MQFDGLIAPNPWNSQVQAGLSNSHWNSKLSLNCAQPNETIFVFFFNSIGCIMLYFCNFYWFSWCSVFAISIDMIPVFSTTIIICIISVLQNSIGWLHHSALSATISLPLSLFVFRGHLKFIDWISLVWCLGPYSL